MEIDVKKVVCEIKDTTTKYDILEMLVKKEQELLAALNLLNSISQLGYSEGSEKAIDRFLEKYKK